MSRLSASISIARRTGCVPRRRLRTRRRGDRGTCARRRGQGPV